MKLTLLAATALLATTGVAAAQDHNPAVKDSSTHMVKRPAEGRSSFTEGQARGRIEKAGYTQVSDLKGTDGGAWRGTAMKDGKRVTVTLDYKGNVTAR
ncbi:PepSY domain-containing protein [Sphingomonas pokkalii]|uniref:Uncharacterized protein n=1 Tax=Sphingomonas pokkalii TaxID=2175090 RepID=A0A2U0SJN0_9SPHN|nr:PepSY domain-containing protein [Sphingomonas pokkalii]PVX31555.1 hypothetical protein DD559_15070 [Sphingomonas pokkalii]